MKLIAQKSGPLKGRIRVPGDKSISHRALIFGALSEGISTVSGLLEADDVLRTAGALRALGAEIERDKGRWQVRGGGWREPARALYAGNAGTGVRLLMGAVAGRNLEARFDGDASLRRRPMGRVLGPLGKMGLRAETRDGKLPVLIKASRLKPLSYTLPVASAQVKSAILLAALGAEGVTEVIEPVLCRDHTERMLRAFGVVLETESLASGGRQIALAGGQSMHPAEIEVPADPSSAAFPVVAGLLVPGSDLVVEGVLMNPLRTGLYDTLQEMGGRINFENERETGGETIADIHVQSSSLKGVEVPEERAPSMIDEYPVLAVAAAFAEGETRMRGLEELRVKESDRLASVAAGLQANGIDYETGADWLIVRGQGAAGGGLVRTHMDHRIAMSFLLLGLVSDKPVEIDSGAMIPTSFPGFLQLMCGLGAAISAEFL